jgi:C1A family cysteine protease
MNQNRKYGHLKTPKINRVMLSSSVLLKTVKTQTPDLSVNLVLSNQSFLIGGNQEPYDQGQLGSCTANALAFAFVFNVVKQNYPMYMPSRLGIYYDERLHFGGTDELLLDNGANISDAEYVIENVGVLPEKNWLYTDDYTNPLYYSVPDTAVGDVRTLALNTDSMYTVNPSDLNGLKLLLTNGYPLVCGMIVDIDVFGSTNTANTGIITQVPNLFSNSLGGHAVVIVGYTADGFFIIRNSWGVNWGLGYYNQSKNIYNYDEYGGMMRGYFKVPFRYITNQQIVLELYAVKQISDTNEAILSGGTYTTSPANDDSFSSDTTIDRSPGIPYNTYIINSNFKILVNYNLNQSSGLYEWYFRTMKTNIKPNQIVYEQKITNFNRAPNNLVKVGFYKKTAFDTKYSNNNTFAIAYNNRIATNMSINVSTGRLSMLTSKVV